MPKPPPLAGARPEGSQSDSSGAPRRRIRRCVPPGDPIRNTRSPQRSNRKRRSPMGRAHGTGRTIVRTEVSSSGFQATAGASTAPVPGSGAKGEPPLGPPPCQRVLRDRDECPGGSASHHLGGGADTSCRRRRRAPEVAEFRITPKPFPGESACIQCGQGLIVGG